MKYNKQDGQVLTFLWSFYALMNRCSIGYNSKDHRDFEFKLDEYNSERDENNRPIF